MTAPLTTTHRVLPGKHINITTESAMRVVVLDHTSGMTVEFSSDAGSRFTVTSGSTGETTVNLFHAKP